MTIDYDHKGNLTIIDPNNAGELNNHWKDRSYSSEPDYAIC